MSFPSRGTRGLSQPRALAIGLALAAVLLASGCGGSGSGESSAQQQDVQRQLELARRQGAVAAHRQERLAELQRRVTRIERGRGGDAQRDGTEETNPPAAVRVFHSPSGNVGCAIMPDGALCSVSSLGETFAFEAGDAGRIEPGLTLSGSAGEEAPYGSTVSAGTISCSVPAESESRGIVCSDSASGHGFEASRVASRQSTY